MQFHGGSRQQEPQFREPIPLTPEEWSRRCLLYDKFILPCHCCVHNMMITKVSNAGLKCARWTAKNCNLCNTTLRAAFIRAGGTFKMSSAMLVQLAKEKRLAR